MVGRLSSLHCVETECRLLRFSFIEASYQAPPSPDRLSPCVSLSRFCCAVTQYSVACPTPMPRLICPTNFHAARHLVSGFAFCDDVCDAGPTYSKSDLLPADWSDSTSRKPTRRSLRCIRPGQGGLEARERQRHQDGHAPGTQGFRSKHK